MGARGFGGAQKTRVRGGPPRRPRPAPTVRGLGLVMSHTWRVHVHGWLLLLPAAVLLVTFTHYPVAATIYTSLFSTPKPGRPSLWVGLDNYQAMVEDPVFWQALGNNFWFALGTIPLSVALATDLW